MSEYQAGIIVVLYVVIVLSIAVLVPLSRIQKQLNRIKELLMSTRQNAGNKNDVSSSDSENQ